MGDWDFHPLNVFIIAAGVVTVFITLIIMVGRSDIDNIQKNREIKVAGYEACGDIADEAVRTLCVGQVEAP